MSDFAIGVKGPQHQKDKAIAGVHLTLGVTGWIRFVRTGNRVPIHLASSTDT